MSSGGAPLPHAIREAFFERYGYHVSPSYGLTEAPTVVAHSFDAVPPDGASGHALPHPEISIRDPEGRPRATGAGGEGGCGAVRTGPRAGVDPPGGRAGGRERVGQIGKRWGVAGS